MQTYRNATDETRYSVEAIVNGKTIASDIRPADTKKKLEAIPPEEPPKHKDWQR